MNTGLAEWFYFHFYFCFFPVAGFTVEVSPVPRQKSYPQLSYSNHSILKLRSYLQFGSLLCVCSLTFVAL